MQLLSMISELNIVEFNTIDLLIQLFFLVIPVGILVGIIALIVMFIKRNKRLNRMEEKLDKLISDKEE